VADRLLDSSDFVIKSTAAASLVSINTLSNFPASLQKGTLDIYIKAIEKGDPAVIGTVADALINPSLKYKEVVKDWNFLYEAKAGLNLPRDVESLEPLEKAIAYFEGKDFSPSKNSYNHPIDWNYIKTIPRDHALHGVHHARELGEQPVAGGLEDAAAVRGDRGIEELRAQRLQARERAFLVGAHHAAKAHHVGGEDRRQASRRGLRLHGAAS
jgi:hypothetical protein